MTRNPDRPAQIPVSLKQLSRLAGLQSALSHPQIDYLLVTHLPNIRYLCGFTGSAGALLVSEEGASFFTDGRYTEQARKEVQGAAIRIGPKAPLLAAADQLRTRRRPAVLGIEGEHLTVALASRLRHALPERFRVKATADVVERLRMVKDAAELALIRAAVNLGSSLFPVACKAIRPGVTETAVAGAIESAARRRGSEGMAFSTIVAAGKRSALPHGRASEAAIPDRGFVVLDFGVILAGYCSDMTRTVHVGSVSRKASGWYEAVLEAQLAAIAAVAPGKAVADVDVAARKLLVRNGLGNYFTHSTGHGVGLEIHEGPRIASRETEVLLPGMVITIEPGIYVQGQGGVRIEDMVAVTDTGCEVLTSVTKELVVL